LQHIPVLGQETIFESDNVGGYPGRRPSHADETAMRMTRSPSAAMTWFF
jgi:hypothetical protein